MELDLIYFMKLTNEDDKRWNEILSHLQMFVYSGAPPVLNEKSTQQYSILEQASSQPFQDLLRYVTVNDEYRSIVNYSNCENISRSNV